LAESMTERQINLVSAAQRHISDAEQLAMAGSTYLSLDQAWHLAGFGPECIRKACLRERAFDRALGHEFTPESEALLDWAIALDPQAWRYHLLGWSKTVSRLAEWDPNHRYERTGKRPESNIRELVQGASGVVRRVICDLWTDGVLREVGL
jgi:hypothetical protein